MLLGKKKIKFYLKLLSSTLVTDVQKIAQWLNYQTNPILLALESPEHHFQSVRPACPGHKEAQAS